MTVRASSIGWGALAFIIGALPAFWLAGPALFADGTMGERLGALAMYGGAVFVLSIGGGALAPSHSLGVSVGIALPVLAVLLLAEWGVAGMALLSVGFVLVAALAAWAGTLLGTRVTAAVMARRQG